MLEAKFKLKVLGDLKYFLDLKIAKSKQGIHLCQHKYTMKLLTHTLFLAAKPKLAIDHQICLNDTNGEELSEPSLYRKTHWKAYVSHNFLTRYNLRGQPA
jgi:hypothetical protein